VFSVIVQNFLVGKIGMLYNIKIFIRARKYTYRYNATTEIGNAKSFADKIPKVSNSRIQLQNFEEKSLDPPKLLLSLLRL
jgi:hypothetical protein